MNLYLIRFSISLVAGLIWAIAGLFLQFRMRKRPAYGRRKGGKTEIFPAHSPAFRRRNGNNLCIRSDLPKLFPGSFHVALRRHAHNGHFGNQERFDLSFRNNHNRIIRLGILGFSVLFREQRRAGSAPDKCRHNGGDSSDLRILLPENRPVRKPGMASGRTDYIICRFRPRTAERGYGPAGSCGGPFMVYCQKVLP